MNKIVKRTVLLGLIISLSLSVTAGVSSGKTNDAKIRTAMVKIQTVQTPPYYGTPWDKYSPRIIYGSGCVIEGRQIITNAHVVSDQTFVQVWRYGQTKKYKAKVMAVSHTADLALLTVEDHSFFKGVAPLKIGALPEIQQALVVMGFPEGGETLSITKGIVSRVEHQLYVHSGQHLLAIQIDAAVNSGNSGGPAMIDDKIVGIAMQSLGKSENISYLVPAPIIKHFLADLKDGQYDGFPEDGIVIQVMENTDMRRCYGLSDDQIGVLVTGVLPGSPADGLICPGDVLLSVDGQTIASDGTIEFRKNERTSADFFTKEHQIGETLMIGVFRKEKKLTVAVKLLKPPHSLSLVANQKYDRPPTYYIYGGLVFMPLTTNYLKIWGRNWEQKAPSELVALLESVPQIKGEEAIVLAKVLPHEVNNGYHEMDYLIITHVNDAPILNMKDLLQKIAAAAQSDFVEFKSNNNDYIIVDPGKVSKAQESILETYSIPADRSEDLRH